MKLYQFSNISLILIEPESVDAQRDEGWFKHKNGAVLLSFRKL
ncbi:hypothetical protein [Kaistella rhinocerotis]|nr:hypothetical protein [Kaistella sp. Ran72]